MLYRNSSSGCCSSLYQVRDHKEHFHCTACVPQVSAYKDYKFIKIVSLTVFVLIFICTTQEFYQAVVDKRTYIRIHVFCYRFL